jgi:hypothetical protein
MYNYYTAVCWCISTCSNQIAFAIMCQTDYAMYVHYVPMSGDFDILPVKIGVCLIVAAAVLFLIDLFVSGSNHNKKS